jgi:pSer/pThr/pTyr-binding forkhead associated (FHA) protein
MPFFLKVLSSPEKKLDGLKFELAEGECLLGRASPPAQIRLEGAKVSKKHCVFTVKGHAVKVDDLRSSNGLFVNGKRVESAVLREKDRLVVGEFVLELTKGDPEPKPGKERTGGVPAPKKVGG